VILIALAALVGIVIVVNRYGMPTLWLLVLPLAGVVLMEFERRRLRSGDPFVDAMVGPGVMVFGSRRRVAWVGVVTVLLGVAALLLAFGPAHPFVTDLGRRSTAGVLLAPLICVIQGAIVAGLALRSGRVRVDEVGVTISAPLSRTHTVGWADVLTAFIDEKHVFLSRMDGGRPRVGSRYLRTDPALIVEIIARCAADPQARPLLGDAIIDEMHAEERWRRHHRAAPAGS